MWKGGPNKLWIRLEGELDMSSAPDLGQAISRVESAGPRLLGIDLRHLSVLDSAGLHVLVDAHTRVSGANRRLVLIRGPSRVQRVFQELGPPVSSRSKRARLSTLSR
jgi:anti-sigma B factor antagonist